MSVEEGNILYEHVRTNRPSLVIEIGIGQGLSSLYILQGLADNGNLAARLISIDPSGMNGGAGVAVNHISLLGWSSMHQFFQMTSEFALPQLLASGLQWEFAFVDSNHLFDQTMLESFYLHRGLPVGGTIAYHDINLLSVQASCNFMETNLEYRLHPIHETRPASDFGGLRLLKKMAPDTRPWFHFKHFCVPEGDQMKPYLNPSS